MTGIKFSTALLLASGLAFASAPLALAQSGQTGAETAIECPAPGAVPADQLSEECKAKLGTEDSAAAPKQDSQASGQKDVVTAIPSPLGDINLASAVLASQFMGQIVYSTTNENVGEINDLVMSSELDTVVAIVGVGGFLGIGEKDVAVPVTDITVSKDENNNLRLTIAYSMEDLKAAPAFDRTVMN